jgi:hypothetical protein
MRAIKLFVWTIALAHICAGVSISQGATPTEPGDRPQVTVLTHVNVFDGTSEKLIENASVLVEGNLIRRVSTDVLTVPGATIIDGRGMTLVPGIIDCHCHPVLGVNLAEDSIYKKSSWPSPMHAMQHPLLVSLASLVLSVVGCAGRPASDVTSALPGEVVEDLGDSALVVYQDSRGAHWFGSDGGGVVRYDGTSLVRFTSAHGLAGNQVRQIQEDGDGRLYVTTVGPPDGFGISRFDGERFTTLVPVEAAGPGEGWDLAPGDLWFQSFGMDDGPYRLDGETLVRLSFPRIALEDTFRARFPNVTYSPYNVYATHRDRSGAMWFGTSSLGVCRYDGRSFQWITEDELTELEDGPSLGVRGIVEDEDGTFWLGNLLHRYDVRPHPASSGVGATWYRREPGPVAADAPDVGNAYFMSGLRDRHGVTWTATYSRGVWSYDGERLTHHPVRDGEGNGVTLFTIYEDRDGVIWVGSHAAGAWCLVDGRFERFRP